MTHSRSLKKMQYLGDRLLGELGYDSSTLVKQSSPAFRPLKNIKRDIRLRKLVSSLDNPIHGIRKALEPPSLGDYLWEARESGIDLAEAGRRRAGDLADSSRRKLDRAGKELHLLSFKLGHPSLQPIFDRSYTTLAKVHINPVDVMHSLHLLPHWLT